MSSTAYNKADLIIPNNAGFETSALQAWRPTAKLLQDITLVQNTANASRIKQDGTLEFVAANTPRWDWSGGATCPKLLIEPQVLNLFDQDLATGAPATQTITVVSGSEYSVTMRGTGSITLSGADTSTVTQASSATFTAATTSLVCTLSGSVDYVNVNLGKPTSIIYTSGSTATRNKEVYSVDLTSITTDEYTVFFDIEADGARLLMEAGTTGFDLDFTGSGKFAMLVGATTITFQFPDNSQPQTSVIFEKPADFRNITFEAKIGTVKLATAGWIASVLLPADYNQWLSGTVSSSFLETDWSVQTNFGSEFREEDWDYFPVINTSSGTNFRDAWDANQLTSFPLLDVSSGTDFGFAWRGNQLTSFPLLDVSSGSDFQSAWQNNQLTTFPLLDVSSGTDFNRAWQINQLTTFPLLDVSSGTDFNRAWRDNQLTSFPANRFDLLTSPADSCFTLAWAGTNVIDAQGMENILVSIDTSGASAPTTGKDISISSNGDTLTAATNTAITNVKARGWTVTIDGVPK